MSFEGDNVYMVMYDALRKRKCDLLLFDEPFAARIRLFAADIGTELIDFVVDRNVHKQGLYMPGVHIPISAPERILEEMPEYVLLLAWNFRDEILRQQDEYRKRGGQFVVPIPHPEIV